MAEPQASRLWMAAQQSGLLDVQSLTACWDAIPLEKRDAVEHLDRRLARQAVQQNFLTLWQAQQLLTGRTSGFRVDRYLLLEVIGQGRMGRVYLARDTRLNRRVALKILAPERMNNSRAAERFKREARVGAQLQHENLVRIYDFGQANGRFFLVMEYIKGKTIGALITVQGLMPVLTAARLTWQIALGLEHAHRKGLIHRDVNPYNVLVTHEGIAKLADLGLAIDLAEDERVTREGATVGTFDYVAPEQARHSHATDIRSDIYSLGCTLYHTAGKQAATPQPGRSPRPVNSTGGADREAVDPKGKPRPAITVLTDDGGEKPVEDLFQAMETAIGAKGWVVLHNREPLPLPAREQLLNLVSTGWLKLRAAQGVKPVLIAELKGQKPFLTVGPDMNLTLEGLTPSRLDISIPLLASWQHC